MINKLDGEGNKSYTAVCDYWRLGAGRSIAQLERQYKEQENPPTKNYSTLHKWAQKFCWEKRIADYLEFQQLEIENIYNEKQIEWTKKQFNLLEDLHYITENCDVDLEAVSVAQYTGAIKTLLAEIRNIFNMNPVAKIASTTPDGKQNYNPNDVSELLKLADAAKRRPT